MIQWSHASMIQRFHESVILQFNNSVTEWFHDSMIRRLNDWMTQWFHDSMTLQFHDSTVLWLNSSTFQLCKNWTPRAPLPSLPMGNDVGYGDLLKREKSNWPEKFLSKHVLTHELFATQSQTQARSCESLASSSRRWAFRGEASVLAQLWTCDFN